MKLTDRLEKLENVTPEVQEAFDKYLERIKAIKWFKPEKIDKVAIEKQAKVALKCFGVKATVEYKELKTKDDWDAAWGTARDAAWGTARAAAWDAAWDASWDASWDAARDAAWDAARGTAWDAARVAAWDAAWGATEIIAMDLEDFNKKYPQGAFLQLIPLWEMGLYPIGVVNGKFVIYLPEVEDEEEKQIETQIVKPVRQDNGSVGYEKVVPKLKPKNIILPKELT